mmetsp:Transcript_55189/g.66446  ORF Transcript_55189/g.66446 Transcript_55189/m.66446 type:complete len:114 (+) Transcript_55189:955-1296(+)
MMRQRIALIYIYSTYYNEIHSIDGKFDQGKKKHMLKDASFKRKRFELEVSRINQYHKIPDVNMSLCPLFVFYAIFYSVCAMGFIESSTFGSMIGKETSSFQTKHRILLSATLT